MACQTRWRASALQGSHPCKNSHPQPRLDFGPGRSTTVLGCRRVIAGRPNWEGTGKIFCLREDLRQELRRFQGRAPAWLLGAW
eukprot:scaffold1091_cov125-Isochrysis_galbana.AAC.2